MTGLRVNVRLSGSLAERLGSRRAVQLPPGACVADLLEALTRDAELDESATGSLAVVAAGTIVSRDRPLADGEQLDVLVPVAGG